MTTRFLQAVFWESSRFHAAFSQSCRRQIYIFFTQRRLVFTQFFQPSAYASQHKTGVWRYSVDDLFMLGVMLGFFLLMTFLIELCAWLVRRR